VCAYIHINYIYVYVYTYIHKYVPYIGRPTRRNTCVPGPVITGSVSLEMRAKEQAARRNKLQARKWEVYKGTLFYDGERALVIKRWLNCVDEDASGLTFEERDPTENVDSSPMPVAMIINSSELRAAGFMLREVYPLELEAAARRRSSRDAGIRQLECMGPKRFILSVDDDTEFRSRHE